LLALAVLLPRPAEASFLATMRARPLRVTQLPPDATLGSKVRISGVFSFFDESAMMPLPAQCGSAEFFCRGDLAVCRREWADIEAAATAGRCVAVAIRLWTAIGQTVVALGAESLQANPYDPMMGVATIPCHPEPPGPLRPDLTLACSLAPEADAGLSPPDAAQARLDAAPPASPDAAAPPPVDTKPPVTMAKRSGCELGSGQMGGGLWLAVLALARLRRRRG
jgi:hypothetical protein